jgi:hypothetical protein
MLDENIKCEKVEGKEYPSIPKDIYQVELLDITQKDAVGKFAKEGEKNFAFQFTILKGRDESQEKDENKELRGRNIWDNFVPTYLYIGKKGKNSLYKVCEAFIGRELTLQEEAEGITGKMLNEFIGKQVRVSIEGKKVGDNIYDNIMDYYKATEQLTPLTDEEKKDAGVKAKDKETSDKKEEEIGVEDIPF